jgi:hypothetical protein
VSASIYQSYAAEEAAAYGVPQSLFSDVLQAESSFNPNAYNPQSGATGIAQFLPSTAANAGYGIAPFNPSDPFASIKAAAQYLAGLFASPNNPNGWTGALAAYSGQGFSGTPYPGNAAIAGDLSALGGSAQAPAGVTSPTSGGTSGGAATGSSGSGLSPSSWLSPPSWLSPSWWLSAIGSFLGGYASRAALIVLAILLLLGAIYLFASRTQGTSS